MKRKINISLVVIGVIMNILSLFFLCYVKTPGKVMRNFMITATVLGLILGMLESVWNRKRDWRRHLSTFSLSVSSSTTAALLLRWGSGFATIDDCLTDFIQPVDIFGLGAVARYDIALLGIIGTFFGLLSLIAQMINRKTSKGTGAFSTMGLALALGIIVLMKDRQNTLISWNGLMILCGLSLILSIGGLQKGASLRFLSAVTIPVLVEWPLSLYLQSLPSSTEGTATFLTICALGILFGGMYAIMTDKSYILCSFVGINIFYFLYLFFGIYIMNKNGKDIEAYERERRRRRERDYDS